MQNEILLIPNKLSIKKYFCPKIEDLPIIRHPAKNINPNQDTIIFQINDISLGTYKDINPECNFKLQSTLVYLSGTTKDEDSIVVVYKGYNPYFYLSIPDNVNPDSWFIEFKNTLNRNQIPTYGISSMKLVSKLSTTGFRNGDPMNFILFQFKTCSFQRTFQSHLLTLFPITTEQDVLNGKWKERN